MSALVNLEHPATYTRAVKAILLNRILLVLSFVGLFVAGALSIEKALNIMLPCGNNTGCAAVAADPRSALFGVPVAYIGLAGYIFFATLAIIRVMKTPWDLRTVNIGFAAAAVGAAFSIYLQYVSLFEIKEVCPYCLTSAITMILTVIVYAMLAKVVKTDAPPASEMTKADTWLIGGLPFVVIVGLALLGGNEPSTKLSVGKIELNLSNLVPPNPNSFGPTDAPITVIEFADMTCPTCQRVAPKLKEFAAQHSQRIRIIFRHYPLKKHEYSHAAAAMGEYAAEKGKFWDFAVSVMGLEREPSSFAELLDIAKAVRLDPNDIKKRLGDTSDPVYERVSRDIALADKIGVDSTPSFVIIAKGLPPDSAGGDIVEKLQGKIYEPLLNAHA